MLFEWEIHLRPDSSHEPSSNEATSSGLSVVGLEARQRLAGDHQRRPFAWKEGWKKYFNKEPNRLQHLITKTMKITPSNFFVLGLCLSSLLRKHSKGYFFICRFFWMRWNRVNFRTPGTFSKSLEGAWMVPRTARPHSRPGGSNTHSSQRLRLNAGIS